MFRKIYDFFVNLFAVKNYGLQLAVALLLIVQCTSAQMPTGLNINLTASPVITGTNSNLPGQIPLQQNASSYLAYPATTEINQTIKNVITLQVEEKSSSTFIPENFSATVKVKIEYGPSATATLNTLIQDLSVSYTKEEGTKYNAKNYFSFDNAKFVKITVVDPPSITPASFPSGFNPIQVLTLLNEMQIVKYFDLANNATITFSTTDPPTPNNTIATETADELKVTWNALSDKGLNAYQLEWTYLENELAGYYTPGSTFVEELFRNNSTRVDLSSNVTSYNIPLYYDGQGKLYYRVRAVNYKSNGSRADGPWTDGTPYLFNGHGSQKNGSITVPNFFNWQVNTSYAEDGKRKTVMQYFDGSLRSRQTVTKDNSTNTIVTAETFYDGQGRPAVQILPAPGISQIIAYQNNLNLFNNQTPGTDPAAIFDLEPLSTSNPVNHVEGLTSLATIGVLNNTGSSIYYSANNSEIGNGSNKYIPKAEDYPFTVTRYTPDATGRVMAQSGVGINHQMGSGHETKYWYGGATQQELDGLFGTEVGNYTHYFKNMVQDANGQMSISYTDMHGRTIATALAGKAPENLNALMPTTGDETNYPGQAGTEINHNLISNENNIIKNNRTIESVNTILVPVRQDYSFTYKLNPQSLQLPSCTTGQNYCYDCMYDLEISITNESGEIPPYIHQFNNVKLTPDDECGTANLMFKSVNYPFPYTSNTISITQQLLPGSYLIRKTLTVNESSFLKNRELFISKAMCKTKKEIIDSLATELCSNPPAVTCTTCLAQLGDNVHDFAKQYFGVTNPTPEQEQQVNAEYESQKARCNLLCTQTSQVLSTKRELMLFDMMPYTGQYAMDPGNPIQGINPSTSTMYKEYDIFSTYYSGSTRPFYKHPLQPNLITNTPGFYLDNNSQQDITIHPDPTDPNHFLLDANTTPDVFEQLFKNKWAEALLPYHPEYLKLKYAEANLATSNNWINSFSQESTYVDAAAANYIITSGTLLSNDPFYTINDPSDPSHIPALKNTMEDWITSHYKIVGGTSGSPIWASMWQIAYAIVKCKNDPDPVSRVTCFTSINPVPDNSSAYTTMLTVAEKDQLWEAFKGLYMAERENQVNTYLDYKVPSSNYNTLVLENYLLRFPKNNTQVAQQFGWLWYPATTGGNPTIPTPTNPNNPVSNPSVSACHSYIQSWKQALLQCPKLAGNAFTDAEREHILSDITDRMEKVCLYGTNTANPQGSSTVNPNLTPAPPDNNFEDIINEVFATNHIDRNNLCNPFIIEFPKPFNKNPQVSDEVISTIDSCHCEKFAEVKNNAAIALGISVGNLTQSQLNQYVNGLYGQTITPELYQALTSHCGDVQQQVCTTTYDTSLHSCTEPESGCVRISEKPEENGQCLYRCTRLLCTNYIYLLPSPQPLPVFLQCNYNLASRCLTCADLSDLTGKFRTEFNTPYNGAPAPVFTGTNLSVSDIERNVLFAKFVNFRTGFRFTWLDYARAATDTSHACDLVHYGDNTSSLQQVICPDTKPLNDITDIFVPEDPCQRAKDMAVFIGEQIYETRRQRLLAIFDAQYLGKCLDAKNIEEFKVHYTNSEYHYTLYYYDQAGQLLKTVPPRGATPNFSESWYNDVEYARSHGNALPLTHLLLLVTHYRYNSLGQVVAQNTPDANDSYFWYDRLGRLVVSQNAKQNGGREYSYTRYDPLGRITEVGQLEQSTQMTHDISKSDPDLQGWLTGGSIPTQVTYTVYDKAYPPLAGTPTYIVQQNLRNRVSYTYTRSVANQSDFLDAGSFYSYDVHGNVNELIQDMRLAMKLAREAGQSRYKKITYNYDLISGKVNAVNYQPGQTDAFYHKYAYDAENRVIKAETSRDKIVWEQDATYKYYKHGPIARTELGQLGVQGVDYAYTLQGWLKGVNSTAISNLPGGTCVTGTSHDVLNLHLRSQYGKPGQYIARQEINFLDEYVSDDNDEFEAFISPTDADCVPPNGEYVGGTTTGDMGGDGNPASMIARDAYGFSLNYFDRDYKPLGTSLVPFATNVYNLPPLADGLETGVSLFNGNIASMMVSLPKLATLNGNSSAGELLYSYRYDQLNRLVGMNAYKGLNKADNTFTPGATEDYKERVSYDPNGNILTYLRNGTTLPYGSQAPIQHPQVAMDNLTYHYPVGNNQLSDVQDEVPAANFTEDIDRQNIGNYRYDLIGNLISDQAGKLETIIWTVYGKISTIIKRLTPTTTTNISYTYDAGGNRVSKTVDNKTMVYVRDAQGNVMSIYESVVIAPATATPKQKEIDLYGSSRLGLTGELTFANQKIGVASGYGDNMDEGVLSTFTRGEKVFELSNHLGNVLATISDKLIAVGSGTAVDHYLPDVVSTTDYAPFGMALVGRTISSEKYRYAFNGKELDKDISEDDYDYGMRISDSRLGRFLSVDPLTKKYPELTPYQFASNTPIWAIDLDGKEAYFSNEGVFQKWGEDKSATAQVIVDNKVLSLNVTQVVNRVHWNYGEGGGTMSNQLANALNNRSRLGEEEMYRGMTTRVYDKDNPQTPIRQKKIYFEQSLTDKKEKVNVNYKDFKRLLRPDAGIDFDPKAKETGDEFKIGEMKKAIASTIKVLTGTLKDDLDGAAFWASGQYGESTAVSSSPAGSTITKVSQKTAYNYDSTHWFYNSKKSGGKSNTTASIVEIKLEKTKIEIIMFRKMIFCIFIILYSKVIYGQEVKSLKKYILNDSLYDYGYGLVKYSIPLESIFDYSIFIDSNINFKEIKSIRDIHIYNNKISIKLSVRKGNINKITFVNGKNVASKSLNNSFMDFTRLDKTYYLCYRNEHYILLYLSDDFSLRDIRGTYFGIIINLKNNYISLFPRLQNTNSLLCLSDIDFDGNIDYISFLPGQGGQIDIYKLQHGKFIISRNYSSTLKNSDGYVWAINPKGKDFISNQYAKGLSRRK